VRNRFGKTKTESSCRPVPLHPLVLNALFDWRAQSPYATDLDFLFPSPRLKGTRPLSPDSILEKSIRPALARNGVVGKQIGWHSFRHSLATNLRTLSVDIKVAQELMRHASCRTLDIYTHAVSQQKREANSKLVEMMLPSEVKKLQHPSAPSAGLATVKQCQQLDQNKGDLVDLIGIEPMTSSMPRRHNTYESAESAKPAQSAGFAAKMLPNLQPAGHRADPCGISPNSFIMFPGNWATGCCPIAGNILTKAPGSSPPRLPGSIDPRGIWL
jgi:hypothetical protein